MTPSEVEDSLAFLRDATEDLFRQDTGMDRIQVGLEHALNTFEWLRVLNQDRARIQGART